MEKNKSSSALRQKVIPYKKYYQKYFLLATKLYDICLQDNFDNQDLFFLTTREIGAKNHGFFCPPSCISGEEGKSRLNKSVGGHLAPNRTFFAVLFSLP